MRNRRWWYQALKGAKPDQHAFRAQARGVLRARARIVYDTTEFLPAAEFVDLEVDGYLPQRRGSRLLPTEVSR